MPTFRLTALARADLTVIARTTGLAWADVALMMHRAEWTQAHDHAHCRFSCLSGDVHTGKLAQHAHAQVVKRVEGLRLGF